MRQVTPLERVYSLASFLENSRDLLNPLIMKRVTRMYLLEKRYSRMFKAVKDKRHMTLIEKDWNEFVTNGKNPSDELIGVIGDRLHTLLLIEQSKTPFDFSLRSEHQEGVRSLYYRWAKAVEGFAQSPYYDLIKPMSHCSYCNERHPVDIGWEKEGKDIADLDKAKKPDWNKLFSVTSSGVI